MINGMLRLSPLLFIILLLSIDLTRPPELVEVLLLLTPFLFLLTTYLFNKKFGHGPVKGKSQTLTLLLFIQLFLFFISTFFSVNIIQSTYSLMRWTAIITTLIILSKHTSPLTGKILSTCVQFLGTAYSLIFLITLVFKINPPDYLNTVRLAGEHNQLASLLVVSIPLILSNLLGKKTNKNVAKLSKIALVINLVALGFTFARGAWLALIFIAPLLWLVRRKSVPFLSKHKLVIVLASLLIVVVVSFGLVNDFWQPNNTDRVVRSFTNLHQQSLNFKSRLSYYSQALVRFKQSPVWGTGLNTYTNGLGEIGPLGGVTNYTHNFLLQILSETGIFSSLIFVAILIHVVYQLFVIVRKNPNSINTGVFLAFVLSLLYSFYDFNLNTSLVFLAIFSLAVSVIGSHGGKKALHNSFFVLGVFVLGVFVAAGLTSTVLYIKAGRLKAGANYQKAGEFYLNSLKIFPFNNDYFRETINYLDNYFPEKSDEVIEKWIFFNRNNGKMYDFLTNRSLGYQDIDTALRYINTSLELGYEPAPANETIQKMFESVGHSDLTTVNPDLIKFINFFDSLSLGQPSIYFAWPVARAYYGATINLSNSLDLELLPPNDQMVVFENALMGYFVLDTDLVVNSGRIIGILDRLMVLDPDDDQYWLYKKVIAGLVSVDSLPAIDNLITELEPDRQELITPSAPNYLLSRLYMTKSKQYRVLKMQDKELEYVNKAIQLTPLTGSLRIYKINRLKDLGLLEESNQALEECMTDISPSCRQWL
jgi:O-antigen ligase